MEIVKIYDCSIKKLIEQLQTYPETTKIYLWNSAIDSETKTIEFLYSKDELTLLGVR